MKRNLKKLIFMRSMVTYPLESIKEYFEEIHTYIKTLKKHAEKELTKIEEWSDEAEQFAELHFEELHKVNNILSRNLLYSIVLSIYTIFEMGLYKICDFVQSEFSIPISYEDLERKSIKRAEIFFNKLLNIKYEDNINNHISNLRNIRNCIAHCAGKMKLSKNKNKIEGIITFYGNDKIENDNGTIIIKEQYIQDSIRNIEIFFDKLFEQIKTKTIKAE